MLGKKKQDAMNTYLKTKLDEKIAIENFKFTNQSVNTRVESDKQKIQLVELFKNEWINQLI